MENTPQTGTSANKGCIMFLALIALAVVLFVVVDHAIKTSAAYRLGRELAKTDPAAFEFFGSPVKEIPFVTGEKIRDREGNDSVRLYTLLYGPKAHGKLYIFGEEKDGTCQTLYLQILTGSRIVLTYDSRAPEKGFQPYTPIP